MEDCKVRVQYYETACCQRRAQELGRSSGNIVASTRASMIIYIQKVSQHRARPGMCLVRITFLQSLFVTTILSLVHSTQKCFHIALARQGLEAASPRGRLGLLGYFNRALQPDPEQVKRRNISRRAPATIIRNPLYHASDRLVASADQLGLPGWPAALPQWHHCARCHGRFEQQPRTQP